MSVKFNADEILSIAERIEQNGARFYRRAAELQTDPAHQQLLAGLAAMEDQHGQIFAKMRLSLQEAEREEVTYDPHDELGYYLQAMADGHIFDPHADPASALGPEVPLAEVFRIAIDMEKESVVFYEGVKGVVPEALGKTRIEEIIKEEMGHIGLLSTNLAMLTCK